MQIVTFHPDVLFIPSVAQGIENGELWLVLAGVKVFWRYDL